MTSPPGHVDANQLQADGYSRTDSGTAGDNFGTTITDKTVYVDVK
jgi:hypothetical protein